MYCVRANAKRAEYIGSSMRGPGGKVARTRYAISSGSTRGNRKGTDRSRMAAAARTNGTTAVLESLPGRGAVVAAVGRPRQTEIVTPASTDNAKITRIPNRLGARSRLNQGIVEYRTEYKPALGPNDAHNASVPRPP